MEAAKEQVTCRLKEARKAKGLSQSELAARIGVKRQAIYDMETGRYVPNTTLALRMAKELCCNVEDLFALENPGEEHSVTLVEQAGLNSSRVSLARVRERVIAYPLDGKWMLNEGFEAADGVLLPDSASVQTLRGSEQIDNKVLLLGCDPAFSILSAHASRESRDALIQCRFASSHLALDRLAAGFAHIAGTHLHNTQALESNVLTARQRLSGTRAMVVAFSFFEEGLMVAAGNPLGIRSVSGLGGGRVRFANRERGAALRVLLDERLAQAGLTGAGISGYDRIVTSHVESAQVVAYHLADAALGLRAVASAYGLDFVPMEAVRCDLVIPCDFLQIPSVRVLMDVLQSRAFRRELSALPGYESSCTGKVIGEI
ncbi:MAG: helix-turn-helix domain-containing protein [Desulfobacteraceae bacterium]|nr:helix-turn-helix domain-containing protein [Desulfobacteraceae bacterium]